MTDTDLSGRELIDNAITRWPVWRYRLVPIGRYSAFAVGTLVAIELDHTLSGAVDRAFFGTRALAPFANDRVDLCLHRRSDGA